MFRQRLTTQDIIPDIYYHIARNMRGRHYSFDHIRQVVIQRGLSWEKSLQLVAEIEHDEIAQRPKVHFPVQKMGFGRHFSCGLCILIAGGLLLPVLVQFSLLFVWLLLLPLTLLAAFWMMRGLLLVVERFL
jgi:hypothetical protein